ncbi:MAG: RluA family pseudouridine synthase [Balneolaceae bacterium]|nr:RluA family pseudouridine synthase [Balneolaceae bacterium]
MDYTETEPNIPIIYEDQHLLVIEKPHDLLSQEDHTGDPDVLRLCKKYLNRKRSGSKGGFLGLVQRLDRPVGGLMMLAKTTNAARSLTKQIRDRLVQKTYLTIVHGNPPANGVLTHYLLKNQRNNVVETVSADNKQAKKAVLSFAKLQTVDSLSLLSIHLQTGRPHQIRVQLSAEGYPIWGDYKYGTSQKPDGRTIALRASELIFKHPQTQKEMRFELSPPDETPWNLFSY